MLLRFSVENFLSFKDEVTLTMVASSEKSPALKENHLILIGGKRNCTRLAGLYGANGAGKSNLIKAARFAQDIITEGTKPKERIPVRPFLLAEDFAARPSKFEFVFMVGKVIYTYGFKADKTRIAEEWLFSTSRGHESKRFERRTEENGEKIVDGKSWMKKIKKDHSVLEGVLGRTRANQLLLYKLFDEDFEEIKEVYNWFDNTLVVIGPDSQVTAFASHLYSSPTLFKLLNQHLSNADCGVNQLKVITQKLDDVSVGTSIQDRLSQLKDNEALTIDGGAVCFEKRDDGIVCLRIQTEHVAEDGSLVPFNFNDESDGTKRFAHLLPALSTDTEEKVYLIDELDRSLHPALSRYFLELFVANGLPKSQLVFTTHEQSLLDLTLLRRDEIWFVEKDKSGASTIYSLLDFKVRPDLRIEKGYLAGRFGAIPFLSDPANLLDPDSGNS